MGEWVRINDGVPEADDYVILYVPPGRYFGASGCDLERFKQEYPDVSHWKVLASAPKD